VDISWGSGTLIGGIITAVVLAVIAIYRAKPQKDIDVVSKQKIEVEVKRLQEQHDRRRTIRLLRLERYLDEDVEYHRKNTVYQRDLRDLIEQCIVNGLLPEGRHLGDPPEPPELPEMPDDAE
jgi:hypothetical protein